MKVKCKVCRRDIEVKEVDYNPGDKIIVECERCGNEVEVSIPERDEKSVIKYNEIVTPLISEQSSSIMTKEKSEVTEEKSEGTTASVTKKFLSTSPSETIGAQSQTSFTPSPRVTAVRFDESKKKGNPWIIVIVLLLFTCGVGGWWYYDNIYLPEKIDREAARTYPIVNINLRSSKMAGSDYNKLSSVPYGGELITYNLDSEWADVKYVRPDGSESIKGYVASPYLLDKRDFYLLNSIFGDNDSREILATAKVRRALLDYYKGKGYVGKMSPDLMNEVGLSAGSDSQWQVFFPRGDQKPNEVVFKRLVNLNSKFTDMALIIKNINNGDRKLLYFYFDDDETPHFLGEMEAPYDGTLKDIVNNHGNFTPIFAN